MVTTLKTLVLKTVTVTGVKPATPADRIGQGLVASRAYPSDNLSPGQIPLPHNPEPEPARSREKLSAMQMRQHLRAGGDAVPPAGSAGCPSAPGLSAGRSASRSAVPFTGWRGTTRTAAVSGTRAVPLTADPGRANFPGDLGRGDRLGDCQSPRRLRGKDEIATRKVGSAATAGK